MDKFLLLALISLFLSCNTVEKETDTVFFDGEIVNPIGDYVVLYKGTKIIDSTRLDGNNRFSFQLDSIEDGLYHFKHDLEYQYVYFEKGDSLLARLNYTDFDESLVFSGTNEDVNNFLLELFLANEKEERMIHQKYFDLEPGEFSNQINTLKTEKLNALNSLKLESKLSDAAYTLAKASINYAYYGYMEVYPFKHKRKLRKNKLPELMDDFYSYRNNVDYNNKSLIYLRPYYDFMKAHFGNLSYMTCSRKCGIKGKIVNNQLHFNKHKLKVIDSLINEKELRDNLFRNVAFNYLLKEHDVPENHEIFIAAFRKVSENNMHKEEIENLYRGIQNIQPRKPVPDIKVVSVDDQNISLSEITKNRKVIFYFWSAAYKRHHENIFKRIKQLQKENSGYEFVGINIKTRPENWKGLIQSFELDPAKQYRADNFEELSEKLVLYPMNKCIITEDAKIVDAFSNIYAKQL
ncbi:TlpA family protein disulfide reductase [Maribacter sp. 2304DJ31-5]|uniref:TlpA family protein disulfide reductase n=1 Tax=Maribacter sp. 2304DJ31-5 TaxID=3386273 RepID=UPI0039BD85FB